MTITCRNGHLQTAENTRYRRTGERVCKVCNKEQQRRYQERVAAKGPRAPRVKSPPNSEKLKGIELWRMAHGFENWVAASTHGRFRSLRTGNILGTYQQKAGHAQVRFRIRGGVSIWFSAPATMLRTFNDRPPEKGHIPIFLDGDLSNLALSNLRWGPNPGSTKHGKGRQKVRKLHTVEPAIGEVLRAKLSENAIYAAAAAAVPRTLSPHAREDIISDLMVAVLAGELAFENIGRDADSFRRAHNRQFNLRGHVSINDEAHSWRGYGATEAFGHENESGAEA